MSVCSDLLKKAKDFVVAASATFAGAPVAVLVAIALNGGFFTAPGAPIPMALAGAASAAAGVLLKRAWDAVDQWGREGCLSRECQGALDNIRNVLAGAMTTVGLLTAACFAVAAVAWIPWFTQPAMWAVYIPMALTAAALVALQFMWAPLDRCQEHVATSRGPLRAGEKASDPWFLRLRPGNEPSYIRSTDASLQDGDFSSQWLECRKFSVREWEVSAIAWLNGTPTPPVTFGWTLAGSPVPSSSVVSSNTESTIVLRSAPLSTSVMLVVRASDATGFTRTAQAEVSLSREQWKCHLVLHFVPPMFQVPNRPPGPVEITPEIESFMRALRLVMESGRGRADVPANDQGPR